jgi:hypothetical protein
MGTVTGHYSTGLNIAVRPGRTATGSVGTYCLTAVPSGKSQEKKIVKRVSLSTASLLVVSAMSYMGSAAPSFAQGGKPPVKPPTQTGVKGATQLAGDNGQIGQNYMIGPKGEELVFTLTGVEYTVARVMLTGGAETAALPKADEKVLILRYSVQNPQKSDQFVNALGLTITAVDAKDVNHVANFMGRQGGTDSVNITLKPAQKLDVFTAITVPAAGPVPKLIIQRGEGTAVLRYDLRGKVKQLAAPFAADAAGASARTEVTATPATFYPLMRFDARLDSTAFSSAALGEHTLEEGQRFLLATVTLKNMHLDPSEYSAGEIRGEVTLASGEKVEARGLLHATRPEETRGEVKPGAMATVRLFFVVPNGDAPKTLRLQETEESRAYIFDISGTK